MSERTPAPRPLADLAVPEHLAPLTAGWLLGFDSPHTRRAYGRDLETWFGFCAEHDLDPLSARRGHIDAFARALEHGWRHPRRRPAASAAKGVRPAPATVARRLAAVSSWYSWLAGEEVINRSPVVHVRRPRVSQDSTTLGPTRDEARRLLDAAEELGPKAHALVGLLLLNGLRVGEALGANVQDLDTERDHRVLRARRKGGQRVLVPLADPTTAALDTLIGARRRGPIFLGSRGTHTTGRLTSAGAAYLIRKVADAAGVDTLSPHSLRHGFVTLALEAGATLTDVQDAAGHADPRTTRRYDRARHRLEHAPTYLLASTLTDAA
jgi:integrase/recombinase XerD